MHFVNITHVLCPISKEVVARDFSKVSHEGVKWNKYIHTYIL
jgi:hypothetical protein